MIDESTSELRSWLNAIGTVTAAVNAAHDLKSLLDLIAATAHELLDLSFCAIMLPDDEVEYLSVAGSSGLPDQYIARVNRDRPVRLEDGPLLGAPASRAFRSGTPCMVRDITAEPTTGWSELLLSQGYRSMLAVPLLTQNGSVGTLNSYLTTPHDFAPAEIAQLELLAEHATLALTSARVLDDLRDKHRFIVRSEEIHDRLLDIAVRSGGVGGIASALHDLLGCDVVIRDVQGAILAAEPALSETATSRGLSPGASASGPGLVRDAGSDVVADVVLNGTSAATVWLLGQAGKLDALSIRAMENASVVLSLELLRQRTAAEVEQALRGELLADLLGGADPASAPVRGRAGLMGHNLVAPHQMLVAVVAGPDTPAKRAGEPEIAQRAATEAVRLTAQMKPRPLIGAVRNVVVALWPENHGVATGETVIRRAFAAAQDGAAAVVVATDLDDNGIPAAYRSARGALAFAAAEGGSGSVVSLQQLGAAGLLLQYAEPGELRRYADRTIGALRRYDSDHGAELIKTLRAYLDSDLDRRATADVLVLHPNTVSQRLRRVESLTGLNLRSSRSVIEARTALMLTDVADAVGSAR